MEPKPKAPRPGGTAFLSSALKLFVNSSASSFSLPFEAFNSFRNESIMLVCSSLAAGDGDFCGRLATRPCFFLAFDLFMLIYGMYSRGRFNQ